MENSIFNIMYNSTLEKLVEKYSKIPQQPNSLVFTRLSTINAQPTQLIKSSVSPNYPTTDNTKK